MQLCHTCIPSLTWGNRADSECSQFLSVAKNMLQKMFFFIIKTLVQDIYVSKYAKTRNCRFWILQAGIAGIAGFAELWEMRMNVLSIIIGFIVWKQDIFFGNHITSSIQVSEERTFLISNSKQLDFFLVCHTV